tara:strand:- start:72 stop:275 length:204 start_codon:yes stop_codon:yes gene_type:complete
MENYKVGFKGKDSEGYTYEIISSYSMDYYLSELDEQMYLVKIVSPYLTIGFKNVAMSGSRLYDYLNN